MKAPGTKVVHVKWLDACQYQGWLQSADWIKEPIPRCDSVGFLIDDQADHLTLAMTLGESTASDVLKIPRGMIVEVVTLGRVPGLAVDL